MKSAVRDVVRTGSSILCVAVATLSAPAFGQSAPSTGASDAPADAPAATGQPDIVVTGTRLTNFAAPTPVTAISRQDLDAKAARSVTDLMADIPALRYNQNSGQVSMPIGASYLDLRALGPARTLLLVDGRRFGATDPSGGVDVNVIPAVLISKIEIVTGGASAAYGSDAVSGVVNMTLDTKIEGIKGSVQYGQTTYDDHRQPGVTLAAGHALLDGRLHILAAGDYFHNSGQLDQSTRRWGRQNYAVLAPSVVAAGQPQRLILPGSTTSQLTEGGVISIATGNAIPALRGIQFGPGGSVLPFRYGTNLGTSFMTGGDGATPMLGANITPRYSRYTGFGKVGLDLGERTTLSADLLWSRSKAFADQLPNPDSGTLVIRRDNAFLPASVRALIPANVATISIGRINSEDGVFNTQTTATVRRYGFGIDGGFGTGWKWSAFAQLTRNSYARDDNHNRITQRFLNAVDAVVNPATGRPACRINTDANPANDDPACVPANVFGPGSISPDAVAYYAGSSISRAAQHQDVYAASLNGAPFSTAAGEIRLATGFEYRREAVRQTSDPISQASGWRQINAQALSGRYTVKEVFAEVGVPLLKDVALARNLDVDGAVRLTDYSTSGSVTTWKLGVNYAPIEAVRFRATASRDIRAPNVNELFSGQAQGLPIIIDPLTSKSLATPVLTGGNPALTPEKARTYTGGFVFQPAFFPRFQLSVDYYRISLKDAIISLQGQQVVDGCYTGGQTGLCAAITRDASNAITRVQATYFNAAVLKTNGVDIEAAYAMPLGSGTLNARLLANYIGKLYNSSIGDTAGTTGQTSGVPHWRGNIFLNYRAPRFTLGALLRYVEGGLYNNLYFEGTGTNSINDNHLGSRFYVDLNASVKLADRVELFAKVNNLFDRDPPIAPQVVTQAAATGVYLYDRIGRFVSGGVRFAF